MRKHVVSSAVVLSLAGCASVTGENTQSVRIEAVDKAGASVADVQCKLVNDRGMYDGKAPATVLVRKSSVNLDVNCVTVDKSEGSATLISRAGAGMWGNILLGGGIGAIVDHNKGTAYNYPNWVRIVIGKALVFDRRNSSDDQPTPGFDAIDPTKPKEGAPTPPVAQVKAAAAH
ncbi:MAG: hypothetical protein JHC61_02130 [Burkholderiaceae bacterium]|nr:hypothetical protein [Burkholderiaceae bacterium]